MPPSNQWTPTSVKYLPTEYVMLSRTFPDVSQICSVYMSLNRGMKDRTRRAGYSLEGWSTVRAGKGEVRAGGKGGQRQKGKQEVKAWTPVRTHDGEVRGRMGGGGGAAVGPSPNGHHK